MTGPSGVVALVLLEWTAGLLAGAAWTQSWSVVRGGHFRIVAWSATGLALMALLVTVSISEPESGRFGVVSGAVLAGSVAYLAIQYRRSGRAGAAVGLVAAAGGVAGLAVATALIDGWPQILAAAHLIAGAAVLGSVTNGMLLGHWYLNQPGLDPMALARLTNAGLAATGAAAVLGLVAFTRLSSASTPGAVLGLPGAGESFGGFFYAIWVALIVFTGGVVWAARRCIRIRSIQSATGLYYVALLTAGVSEFVVRYLMVNVT